MLLVSFWVTAALTSFMRALPILWEPQLSIYLTSFLHDPASSCISTRLLLGLVHWYVYCLSVSLFNAGMATVVICCDAVTSIVRKIK